MTRRKLRRLELLTGAPSKQGQVRAGDGMRNKTNMAAEREIADKAEQAYRRTINDWTAPGARRNPGHAMT